MHAISSLRLCLVGLALSLGSVTLAQDSWIKNIGTPADDHILGLAAGNPGSVFIAGYTEGKFGETDFPLWDAFLALHDTAGEQIWARQIGTAAEDYAHWSAPDGAGGAYITGQTRGKLGAQQFGGADAWLARYSAAGNQLWIAQLGTSEDEIGYGLAADGLDGVFVSGNTRGDLGGSHAGGADAFLARYDSSGVLTWVVQFGTPEEEEGRCVCSDGAGGAYISGYSGGDLAAPNAGGSDLFLGRCDAAGQQLWMIQLGTEEADAGRRLVQDGPDAVVLAARSAGSLGGPSAGGSDVVMARYTSQGEQAWIRQFGTEDGDSVWGLTTDGQGGFYVSGETSGDWGGPNAGIVDGFLVRCDAIGTPVQVTQFGTDRQEYRPTAASDGAGGAFVAGFSGGAFGGQEFGGFDGFLGHFPRGCYPDLDGNGLLDLFDFLAFVNLFNAGDAAADCDANGVFDLFDFLCFVNSFNAGC